MTPAEMLAPQPHPAATLNSQSVTDWLLDEIPRDSRGDLIRELLEARRDQGRARYGTELQTYTGRDPRCDALQEAIDLLLYLAQDVLEGPGGGGLRVRLAYALALDLATELAAR